MSFRSHLKSQKDSVKYLEEIAKGFPNKLRVRWTFKRRKFCCICFHLCK
ncbi:MAG: DUF2974 domain-containing protein [Clostridia bacterium]|nr:DUF2974 domain-containing protein [Clostridia bacterium]